MRRYEKQKVTQTMEVLVEAKCDRCGVAEKDADMGWLCPVVIEVNRDEEGGATDKYDYCNDCLVALADVFVAAGSRAPLVTGSEEIRSDD
jgi:hypothetical protein